MMIHNNFYWGGGGGGGAYIQSHADIFYSVMLSDETIHLHSNHFNLHITPILMVTALNNYTGYL